MIQIEEQHLKLIKQILAQYPYEFYVFGSRAKGLARKFSDLDLCVKEQVSLVELEGIKLEFAESDLPYTIDIISLPSASKSLRQQIEPHLLKL
jgi:predicted nucleotidyltransferase